DVALPLCRCAGRWAIDMATRSPQNARSRHPYHRVAMPDKSAYTNLVDPTIPMPQRDRVAYAPRPGDLKGLRIGVVENTTVSADAVLGILARNLETAYGMKMGVLVHKAQRAPLKSSQVAEVKDKTDFVITGIGA